MKKYAFNQNVDWAINQIQNHKRSESITDTVKPVFMPLYLEFASSKLKYIQ